MEAKRRKKTPETPAGEVVLVDVKNNEFHDQVKLLFRVVDGVAEFVGFLGPSAGLFWRPEDRAPAQDHVGEPDPHQASVIETMRRTWKNGRDLMESWLASRRFIELGYRDLVSGHLELADATGCFIDGCQRIESVRLPKAVSVEVRDCDSLRSVCAPKALRVNVCNDQALRELIAPEAGEVDISLCHSLTEAFFPHAASIRADFCRELRDALWPVATYAGLRGCESLVSVDLPLAETVDLRDCDRIGRVNLPAARWVCLAGCRALSEARLPAAKEVIVDGQVRSSTIISIAGGCKVRCED